MTAPIHDPDIPRYLAVAAARLGRGAPAPNPTRVAMAPIDVLEVAAEPPRGDFPIADYDILTVAEVISVLPQLDPSELTEVRDREQAGRARPRVIEAVDRALRPR